MKKLVLIAVSMLLLLTSCEKESPVVIIVTTPYTTDASPKLKIGENLVYNIEARANEATFSKFRITSYNSTGTQILLDSTCFTKNLNFEYIYVAPPVTTTTDIILKFEAFDTNGNQSLVEKALYIITDGEKLKESDNITMFSAYSGGKSGFKLPEFEVVSVTYNEEGLTNDPVHIYDKKITTVKDTLSRTWTSSAKCDLRFVKYEGFDYGSATIATITMAYQAATRSNEANNLKSGDIILIGKGDTALGAIKIKQVYDMTDPKEDRYEFSIKFIVQ